MKSTAQEISETEIAQFKKKLDLQRVQAQNFLRQAEAEQRNLDTGRPPELGDFCAETATREYLFERISQQRRLLHRVEVALERIQAGTFGVCVTCGEGIPGKRLKVVPWTEYCLHCQEERERKTAALQPASCYLGRTQRVA